MDPIIESMPFARELSCQRKTEAFRCTGNENYILFVHVHMIGSEGRGNIVRTGGIVPVRMDRWRDEGGGMRDEWQLTLSPHPSALIPQIKCRSAAIATARARFSAPSFVKIDVT